MAMNDDFERAARATLLGSLEARAAGHPALREPGARRARMRRRAAGSSPRIPIPRSRSIRSTCSGLGVAASIAEIERARPARCGPRPCCAASGTCRRWSATCSAPRATWPARSDSTTRSTMSRSPSTCRSPSTWIDAASRRRARATPRPRSSPRSRRSPTHASRARRTLTLATDHPVLRLRDRPRHRPRRRELRAVGARRRHPAGGRARTAPAESARSCRSCAGWRRACCPFTLGYVGTPHPDRTARLVLTGPGGGTFVVSAPAASTPPPGERGRPHRHRRPRLLPDRRTSPRRRRGRRTRSKATRRSRATCSPAPGCSRPDPTP